MGQTLDTATRTAAPTAVHEVQGSGGVRLHAREWGTPDGPAIVFVHGWSQSQLCWSRQVAGPLADTFRLVTFDLRGHGKSGKPHDPVAYGGETVRDAIRLLDHLGIRRAHLVGYSLGAIVTAKLAVTDPWLKIFLAFYVLVGIGILVEVARRLGMGFIAARAEIDAQKRGGGQREQGT